MRVGAFVPVTLLVAAAAVAAPMKTSVSATTPSPELMVSRVLSAPLKTAHATRRSTVADVDSRVLASLFANSTKSDFDLALRAGEMTCDAHTCSLALMVQLPPTSAPTRLSIAVANPKGELSDVKHTECLTTACSVTLVIEPGRNTISVGAADPVSHTAGFAITQINAATTVPMSARGRTEWF